MALGLIPSVLGCRKIDAEACPLITVAVSYSIAGSQSGLPDGYGYSFSYTGGAVANRVEYPISGGGLSMGEFAIGRGRCDPLGLLNVLLQTDLPGQAAEGEVTGSDIYTVDGESESVPYEGTIQLYMSGSLDTLHLSATASPGESGEITATGLIPWSWSDGAAVLSDTVIVPFTYGDVSGTATFTFSATNAS